MKIDNSVLQAGALVIAGGIALFAAVDRNWAVAGSALTGLFAIINIHPKPPTDPQA